MEILSMTLTSDPLAPRRARRAIEDRFAAQPRAEELLLCVSEVVTNAVLHAGSPQHMRVSQAGTTVLVEVADADERAPVLSGHDPHATSGRGLRILDQLAARWGSRPTDGGKSVWFEFDLSTPDGR
jgi:anti-sigma regulatory factor (Ser/Thr protein kinase)